MTIREQLHNSATHKAGIDPACPGCRTVKSVGRAATQQAGRALGRTYAKVAAVHGISTRSVWANTVANHGIRAWEDRTPEDQEMARNQYLRMESGAESGLHPWQVAGMLIREVSV